MDEYEGFTKSVIDVMRAVPRGRVVTYGGIAALAGHPAGARQVSRLLHSLAGKLDLPWFRIVGKPGRISLPPGGGFEEQAMRLRSEGVEVGADGRVDLTRYGWYGSD